MLPTWNPDRMLSKIPLNLACVGGRRCGKSVATACLLHRMRRSYDLVVAFIGSAACSPVVEELMLQNWDGRFFFAEWNTSLVDRLLEQQEELKGRGVERQVMILVDDVVMTGKAADQISNLGMRGRHFNVSIMACAVSYTTLPKKFRRSLDALLVFSCPMTGDMQILTWEFSRRASMARFALDSLEEHQCLVLETLQKQQRLFTWRAEHLTVANLQPSPCPSESDSEGRERSGSSEPASGGTAAAPATCGADPPGDRPEETSAGPDRSRSPACTPPPPAADPPA